MSSNDASPYGDMMHLLRKYDVAPLRSAMMRCLPQNVAKPRIIRRSRHHWRSQHHLPQANIITKRTFVSRQRCVFCWLGRSDFDGITVKASSLVNFRTLLYRYASRSSREHPIRRAFLRFAASKKKGIPDGMPFFLAGAK